MPSAALVLSAGANACPVICSARTSAGSGSPWMRGGNIRSAKVLATVPASPPINPEISPLTSDLSFTGATSVSLITPSLAFAGVSSNSRMHSSAAEREFGSGLAKASAFVPLVDDDAEIAERLHCRLHIAANRRASGCWSVVRLFDRHHATVGPGVFRHGIQRCRQVAHAQGEVLSPCTYRPQQSTRAELAGIRIRQRHMQRGHVFLDGEVWVFPAGEAVYCHVAGFRGRRNQVQLLPGRLKLLWAGGCALGACRRAIAAGKRDRSGKCEAKGDYW